MAIKMRLTRRGAKKAPRYRVVVARDEAPRDGNFLEIVGRYDPTQEPAEVIFEKDRVDHWLSSGAQMTPTVKSLYSKYKRTAEGQ